MKLFLVILILNTLALSGFAQDTPGDSFSIEDLKRVIENPDEGTIYLAPSKESESEEVPGGEILDSKGKKVKRTIYYLWGYLEKRWVNAQYEKAYFAIQALRKAGWPVVVDGWVTKNEAITYLSNENNFATFWSSHGTSDGRLTVQKSETHYTYLSAQDLQQNSESHMMRFILLCSCYSQQNGDEFNQKLSADTFGFKGTVLIQTCASHSSQWFIKKLNSYI